VSGDIQKSFDILCKTIAVPEVTMEPIEMVFKGHTLKLPGRVNQTQEITVTFYLDEYHKLRRIFYDWINSIDNRFYGNKSDPSAALYEENAPFGQIILKARDFSESMSEPMNYIFEDIYPTSVSGVEFNTAGNNEVLEFTVIFAFTKFSHYDEMPENIVGIDDELDSF